LVLLTITGSHDKFNGVISKSGFFNERGAPGGLFPAKTKSETNPLVLSMPMTARRQEWWRDDAHNTWRRANAPPWRHPCNV